MELYIHIPFCQKKCAYCDFLSFPCDRGAQRAYVDALLREVSFYADESEVEKSGFCGEPLVMRQQDTLSDYNKSVSSVFFGGGTPSLLPGEWIEEIMRALRQTFQFDEDAEISIEANPGTVDRQKLQSYLRAGINRISFGCQSAVDEELERIGRIHRFSEFKQCFQDARDVGFTNINVDLMSALPGQTEVSWEQSLRTIADLGPEHISAYSLILEEGTPLYEQYETNPESLHLADEEAERRMYRRTAEVLAEYGYRRYEISNYAREGYRCRHNVGYWQGVPYLGLGLGSSSYMNHCRFKNTEDMEQYLHAAHPKEIRCEVEPIDREGQMEEFAILGLRMTDGIDVHLFEKKFGVPFEDVYGGVCRKYEKMNLLERSESSVYLTEEGLSLSNTIMADFLL